MFRFEHPSYLYVFALLPLLAVVFWFFGAGANRQLAALPSLTWPAAYAGGFPLKHRLKFGLALLAWPSSSWAWPTRSGGSKREKVKRKSVDVLIALDISNSMYAQDIPPADWSGRRNLRRTSWKNPKASVSA
ncbi:MAG: hypothetical protein IPM82_16410 [Saprospiraceae bacterium]|nr:hypothetical protein [Saprospiraceae bacterium]